MVSRDAISMSDTPASPRITVITATYNSSKTLKLALQSLLAQKFTDFEAWIIGDACTDDSERVVAEFGDARLHWHNLPLNIGSQFGPNNEGLRRARGEYIAYLGHDDLWFPWHLSGLFAHIEHTQADLVHPLGAVFRPAGLTHIVGPPPTGTGYGDHFIFPSSWLHRRETVLALGGWRNQRALREGVDRDLLRRFATTGKRIEFCPQLSVLKFPSTSWGIYSWAGTPPQAAYLQKVLEIPHEFYQQCLLESAVLCARQQYARPRVRSMVKEVMLRIEGELYRFWGEDRAPLRQYLIWKEQRRRRRNRKVRGLE